MTSRRGQRGDVLAANVRTRHIPVLLSEVLEALAPRDGETFIDATFGAGGYTRAVLEAADCRVVAIDRDPEAIAGGAALAAEFPDRLKLVEGRFGDLDRLAAAAGAARVDGVMLDVGVSSMQLEDAERGFSFQSDGPLDMRMSLSGRTAADVIAEAEEPVLAQLIRHLGEERRARAIARAIVKARAERPITGTLQLADIVSRAVGGRRGEPLHPATRTFQALRICVNDELGELARALAAAERCLVPGGRLVVVTFHSLEDRIVKRFLAGRSGKQAHASRHMPATNRDAFEASFRILNPRPLTPSKEETAANPRARSARLRSGVRTDAPPRPLNLEELGVPAIPV